MNVINYREFQISVTHTYDYDSESYVIELRGVNPDAHCSMALDILIPEGGAWIDAKVSVDPQSGIINADLLAYLLENIKNYFE